MSDEGEGSVFWFTISAQGGQAFEDLPNVGTQVREAALQPFAAPPRVLLVDDNAINQKVGQRLLAQAWAAKSPCSQ